MKFFGKKKAKGNRKKNDELLLAKWDFVKYLAEHDDDDDVWSTINNIVEDIDLFFEGSVYYCDFDTILNEIAKGYELIN